MTIHCVVLEEPPHQTVRIPRGSDDIDSPVQTLSIGDVSNLEPLFRDAHCLQLTAGPFSVTGTITKLGAFRIFQLECSQGLQIRKYVSSERLLVGLLCRGRQVLEHARDWQVGDTLAVSGAELDLSIVGPSRVIWIELDLSRLSQINVRLLDSIPSLFTRTTDGMAYSHLEEFLTALLDAKTYFSLGYNACSPHAIEKRLLRCLQSVLYGDQRNLTRHQLRGLLLARRAERYMWDHNGDPLTLAHMSVSMGCSVRSLIYSFKDSFGLTPMVYLKILRLNAVRRRLMAGANGGIFNIAADFGFWHMGHFGVDYKLMFGITPSHTVSRQGALS